MKIAEKLIDILENDIAVSGNFFQFDVSESRDYSTRYNENQSMSTFKKTVLDELINIGFLTFLTNAPFDIIAKERRHEKKILSVVSNDAKTIEKKVEVSKKITSITGDYSICISEKNQDLSIPVIKLRDLGSLHNTGDLIQILAE